jgi:hypothetical protein
VIKRGCRWKGAKKLKLYGGEKFDGEEFDLNSITVELCASCQRLSVANVFSFVIMVSKQIIQTGGKEA